MLAFAGVVVAVIAAAQEKRTADLLGELSLSAVGWGALAALLKGVGGNLMRTSASHFPLPLLDGRLWLAAGGLWIVGWALIGLSVHSVAAPGEAPAPPAAPRCTKGSHATGTSIGGLCSLTEAVFWHPSWR